MMLCFNGENCGGKRASLERRNFSLVMIWGEFPQRTAGFGQVAVSLGVAARGRRPEGVGQWVDGGLARSPPAPSPSGCPSTSEVPGHQGKRDADDATLPFFSFKRVSDAPVFHFSLNICFCQKVLTSLWEFDGCELKTDPM